MKLYDGYPEYVIINGKEYAVYTDFREWMKLIDMLKDAELNAMEKATCMMYWFVEELPDNIEAAINSLAMFIRCEEKESKSTKATGSRNNAGNKPSFSYEYDADAIIAGFQQIYGIDLLEVDYMHWWQFKFLLEGLPDETEFKRRIYYRTVNLAEIKDSKYRKELSKMKLRYALPSDEITDEDIGSAFW